MLDFIHNDPEFKELLSIVSTQKGIDITLVEKDYWNSRICSTQISKNKRSRQQNTTSRTSCTFIE
jgi:hypothetical protein